MEQENTRHNDVSECEQCHFVQEKPVWDQVSCWCRRAPTYPCILENPHKHQYQLQFISNKYLLAGEAWPGYVCTLCVLGSSNISMILESMQVKEIVDWSRERLRSVLYQITKKAFFTNNVTAAIL